MTLLVIQASNINKENKEGNNSDNDSHMMMVPSPKFLQRPFLHPHFCRIESNLPAPDSWQARH